MVEVTAQSLIEQYGEITPAEAVDYVAVNIEGYTQEEWSEKRGIGGHQSVGQNARNARKKINNQADPRDVIQEIVVDPDDVIEALSFNAHHDGSKQSAVLRVSPPFHIKSKASIHVEESGNYYPPDMSPQPIHIKPKVFVNRSQFRSPTVEKRTARENARGKFDDPTDKKVEEWEEQAIDIWEADTRNILLDETDINNSEYEHGSPHVVSVRYES